MKRHTESFKIIKSTKNTLVVDFSKKYLDLIQTFGLAFAAAIAMIVMNLEEPFLFILAYVGLPFLVVIFLSLFFKKHLLKRIEIAENKIFFTYYLNRYNHYLHKIPNDVRILAHTKNDKVEMELFDTRIPLKSAADFPILLDNITDVLQLEIEKSIKLEAGKDLLKFKRVNNLNVTN